MALSTGAFVSLVKYKNIIIFLFRPGCQEVINFLLEGYLIEFTVVEQKSLVGHIDAQSCSRFDRLVQPFCKFLDRESIGIIPVCKFSQPVKWMILIDACQS